MDGVEEQRVRRRYEDWPSNNKFFCGGRLITGPDFRFFFLSLFFLVTTPALYWAFSASFIVDRLHVVALVIHIYLFILCATSFLICAFIDPGIYPRRVKPGGIDAKKNPMAKPPKSIKLDVGGLKVDSKYCNTCNIYRPPRCSHCSVCNNCVDRFDHHCPWIGNCVARRNYRFFIFFISTASLLAGYTCGLCICEMVMRANDSGFDSGSDSLRYSLSENPVTMIIGPFCAFATLAIGGLFGFHVFLMCNNVTTNEQLKHTFRGKPNPYFEGRCFYIIITCFNVLGPSFINPRAVVDDDAENSDS